MFVSAGLFLWNLSGKQALAADRVQRLEAFSVRAGAKLESNTDTVHKNEQNLKYLQRSMEDVKLEQIRQTELMNKILLELRK